MFCVPPLYASPASLSRDKVVVEQRRLRLDSSEGFAMHVYSRSDFLVRDMTAAGISKRLVQELVAEWSVRLDETASTALTTITEHLVIDAVRSGTGPMLTLTLSAIPSQRRLQVAVLDGSRILPRHEALVPGFRHGAALIERLSVRHGTESTACGERFWADIALPAQRSAHRWRTGPPRQVVRALVRRLSAVHQLPTVRAGRARHGLRPSPRPSSSLAEEARVGQRKTALIPHARGEIPCPSSS